MYKFVKIRPSNSGFDIRVNFWLDNYQLRFVEPFKQLYDRDTSTDKVTSSYEMWCLWLYVDPSYENKIGKLFEAEKRSAIKSYCPTFDFNDEVINKCILEYPEICMSDSAKEFTKSLNQIRKFKDLIDEMITTKGLTLDEKVVSPRGREEKVEGTAKQLLGLKKAMHLLWKDFFPLKSAFEEEMKDAKLFGGGRETALERGTLMLVNEEDED
jgi:hypothetical protein